MKKNVLYVFSGEKAQGAEIVLERLMHYNAENVDAHLFIAPGNFAEKLLHGNKSYKITLLNDLKKLNRSSGGAILFYSRAIKNYFSLCYKTHRYVKKNKIDIVHANTIVPATYLIPLVLWSKLFLRKIRFIWSDHDLTYYSRLDNWFSKKCVGLYDRTLAVSNAVKKKYGKNKKVIVLYNGLDTTEFKNNAEAGLKFRNLYGIEEDALVIGMAGVIVPRKGQLALADTFRHLSFQDKHIRLVLAGRFGEDHPAYANQVKATISANPKVFHIGYVEDMVSFYNGCDIVISNTNISESEPLGTSIYEAMACEKIVIASNTGGTPEIITDQIDGFLFPADQPFELQSKLEEIISSYPLYGNVKKKAREKAELHFNISRMTVDYNLILKNLTVN